MKMLQLQTKTTVCSTADHLKKMSNTITHMESQEKKSLMSLLKKQQKALTCNPCYKTWSIRY